MGHLPWSRRGGSYVGLAWGIFREVGVGDLPWSRRGASSVE